MNSTPFKKRNNPLDSAASTQPAAEKVKEEVSFNEPAAPTPTPTPAPARRTATKTVVVVEERVKYTATMEKNIRRRLKLAAAKRDVQISEFIEAAVLEKLDREGD